MKTNEENRMFWIKYRKEQVKHFEKLVKRGEESYAKQTADICELWGKVSREDMLWMQRNADWTREQLAKDRADLGKEREQLAAEIAKGGAQ